MTLQDITILALVLIISLSGVIINLVKKGGAGEIKYEQDGKTLLVFRLVVPLALYISAAFYFFRIGHFEQPLPLFYIGCVLAPLGLLVRWYAVWSLGNSFTVKVTILKDQRLNTSGIYKRIRHPSYTGLLLYYAGLGLLMENWVGLSLLLISPIIVVLVRIRQEEEVLNKHFGEEYKTYSGRSWKLFPFVF